MGKAWFSRQNFSCVMASLFTIFTFVDASEDTFECVFSKEQYNSAENIFTNNADDTENLVRFLEEKVLPHLSQKQAFFDIGAGPGIITQRIAKHFHTTTVLEPDKNYAPIYFNRGYTAYLCNFQDLHIPDSLDLIVCSHVLYHIPRNDWGAYLNKLMTASHLRNSMHCLR